MVQDRCDDSMVRGCQHNDPLDVRQTTPIGNECNIYQTTEVRMTGKTDRCHLVKVRENTHSNSVLR